MEAQKPFQVISRIRATEALEHAALGEMGGQPFVAVARRPNQLIIKNLETGVHGKLTMLHCPGIPFIDVRIGLTSPCSRGEPISNDIYAGRILSGQRHQNSGS